MVILLVHGLGRTERSFFLLRRRLSSSGHTPEFFSYSSWAESHESILARLVAKLYVLAAAETEVGLVGHSFGGLLLREAIALTPEQRVRHLVMLGTPNRLPRLALTLYPWFPSRLLRGTCRECVINASWFRKLPALSVPYTVVAGTAGWRGPMSPFKGESNDGAVAVSETLVKGDDQPVLVPNLHTFLMNSRRVHGLIIEKLAAMESDHELDELGHSASSCAAAALDNILGTDETRIQLSDGHCKMRERPPDLEQLARETYEDWSKGQGGPGGLA